MPPKKILVVRNDRIGDFMLAWPSFAMLKNSLPESRISALVPEYTKPLARLCPWIDEIIVDPDAKVGSKDWQGLVKTVNEHHFDAMLTLISTTRIGWLGKKTKIPHRLAPATKFAQIFYNDRLVQHRSLSLKPEFEYNLDLIRWFLKKYQVDPLTTPPPFLKFSVVEQKELRRFFLSKHAIPAKNILIFLHAGSGGSANNLSIEQYADLAERLQVQNRTLVLTAGPGEAETARNISKILQGKGVDHRVYESKEGIVSFARHLGFADLFIAGSTGPLHIAGALDVPTVAFYPGKRSSTPLRWRTLNRDNRCLAFTPPPGKKNAVNMSLISMSGAAEATNNFIGCLPK